MIARFPHAWFARLALGLLIAGASVTAWQIDAGPTALAHGPAYGLATLPGWPIGFALFGRRHPAAWVAGAVIGYALTVLALWVPMVFGAPRGFVFAASWALVTSAAWVVAGGRRAPAVPLPAWKAPDTVALCLILLLVPVLMGPPLAKVGVYDDKGARYYRAYFTADFVWHTALTAEMRKFDMPPRNPYLAAEPVHYYWAYFVVPAVVSGAGPAVLQDVQGVLKANEYYTGFLFIAAIFIFTWCAVGRAAAAAAAVLLAVVAASAEGLYLLHTIHSRDATLSAVRDYNVDAMAAWDFGGLRIDGLARSMWYNPQHSLAAAAGLIGITVAGAAGAAASPAAILPAGLALGASVLFNPFIGGIFCFIYGIAGVIDAVVARLPARAILAHALAVPPVLLALGWCVANRMVEGAGGTIAFGFTGLARNAPVITLILSLGPLLIPVVGGLLPVRGLSLRPAVPALVAVPLSLLTMYFVALRADVAWVGFRAGQIFQVTAPVLAARFFAWSGEAAGRRRAGAVVLVLLLGIGLPTTAIDLYNAQDVTNRGWGAGFPWTFTLSPEQQESFTWVKRATPPAAVVQMSVAARGSESWSLIPTFAERRMAAGQPMSLLPTAAREPAVRAVEMLYGSHDPAVAWSIARTLRIDYLYLDGVERRAYPQLVDMLNRDPTRFRRVFERGDVLIYAVLRPQEPPPGGQKIAY